MPIPIVPRKREELATGPKNIKNKTKLYPVSDTARQIIRQQCETDKRQKRKK